MYSGSYIVGLNDYAILFSTFKTDLWTYSSIENNYYIKQISFHTLILSMFNIHDAVDMKEGDQKEN